jgi:hypothetical protein
MYNAGRQESATFTVKDVSQEDTVCILCLSVLPTTTNKCYSGIYIQNEKVKLWEYLRHGLYLFMYD